MNITSFASRLISLIVTPMTLHCVGKFAFRSLRCEYLNYRFKICQDESERLNLLAGWEYLVNKWNAYLKEEVATGNIEQNEVDDFLSGLRNPVFSPIDSF